MRVKKLAVVVLVVACAVFGCTACNKEKGIDYVDSDIPSTEVSTEDKEVNNVEEDTSNQGEVDVSTGNSGIYTPAVTPTPTPFVIDFVEGYIFEGENESVATKDSVNASINIGSKILGDWRNREETTYNVLYDVSKLNLSDNSITTGVRDSWDIYLMSAEYREKALNSDVTSLVFTKGKLNNVKSAIQPTDMFDINSFGYGAKYTVESYEKNGKTYNVYTVTNTNTGLFTVIEEEQLTEEQIEHRNWVSQQWVSLIDAHTLAINDINTGYYIYDTTGKAHDLLANIIIEDFTPLGGDRVFSIESLYIRMGDDIIVFDSLYDATWESYKESVRKTDVTFEQSKEELENKMFLALYNVLKTKIEIENGVDDANADERLAEYMNEFSQIAKLFYTDTQIADMVELTPYDLCTIAEREAIVRVVANDVLKLGSNEKFIIPLEQAKQMLEHRYEYLERFIIEYRYSWRYTGDTDELAADIAKAYAGDRYDASPQLLKEDILKLDFDDVSTETEFVEAVAKKLEEYGTGTLITESYMQTKFIELCVKRLCEGIILQVN